VHALSGNEDKEQRAKSLGEMSSFVKLPPRANADSYVVRRIFWPKADILVRRG
jgi:hypothetical protein